MDVFLHRPVFDGFGAHAGCQQRAEQVAPALQGLPHTFGQPGIDQAAQTVVEFFQIIHAQGPGHAPGRAKGIDQHRQL